MTDKLIYIVKVFGGLHSDDSYENDICATLSEKEAKSIVSRLKRKHEKLKNIIGPTIQAYNNANIALESAQDNERIRINHQMEVTKQFTLQKLRGSVDKHLTAAEKARVIAIELGATKNDLGELGFDGIYFDPKYFDHNCVFTYKPLELR